MYRHISKYILVLVVVSGYVSAAHELKSSQNEKPRKSRQIFRDSIEGSDGNRPSEGNSPHQFRERQENFDGTGQFPLGPRPMYDNEEFMPVQPIQQYHAPNEIHEIQLDESNHGGVNRELLDELASFDSPNLPRFNLENNDLSYTPDDDENNAREVTNEPIIHSTESFPTLETRSPSHRYPEDQKTTKPAMTTHSFSPSSHPSFEFSPAIEETQEHSKMPHETSQFERPSGYTTSSAFHPSLVKRLEDKREHRPTVPVRRSHRPEGPPSSQRPSSKRPAFQQNRRSSQIEHMQEKPRHVRKAVREQERHEIEQETEKTRHVRKAVREQERHEREQEPVHEKPRHNRNTIREQERHPYQDEPRIRTYDEDQDYFEEDYEDDEPDRLEVLLEDSKFSCVGFKDGYYADETVDCEVFHHCADNVKHSWLCPNEAAFHQVHLICMPRGEDNICKKSSQYHFVNEFLYKEAETNPENRTYVDRYYPEGYQGGVANIPDDVNGHPPPQAARPKQYKGPYFSSRPAPPAGYQGRPSHHQQQSRYKDSAEFFKRNDQEEEIQPRRPKRPMPQQLSLQHLEPTPVRQEEQRRPIPSPKTFKKPVFVDEPRMFSKPHRPEHRPQSHRPEQRELNERPEDRRFARDDQSDSPYKYDFNDGPSQQFHPSSPMEPGPRYRTKRNPHVQLKKRIIRRLRKGQRNNSESQLVIG